MDTQEISLKKGNIEKLFDVAEFERRIMRSHVKQIKTGILQNRLLDNNITAITKNGTFIVIDGQHRLEAIKGLLNEGKLKSYKVTVRIVKSKQAREAYMDINKGKSLTSQDYLKIYENDHSLFQKLGKFCSHYGSRRYIKYTLAVTGIAYYLNSNMTTTKEAMIKMLFEIDEETLERMYLFLNDMDYLFSDKKHYFYRYGIFCALASIYLNNFDRLMKHKKKSFQSFLKIIKSDQFIYTNRTARDKNFISQLLMYISQRFELHFSKKEQENGIGV